MSSKPWFIKGSSTPRPFCNITIGELPVPGFSSLAMSSLAKDFTVMMMRPSSFFASANEIVGIDPAMVRPSFNKTCMSVVGFGAGLLARTRIAFFPWCCKKTARALPIVPAPMM